MIERSICYFKTRGERRATKGDERGLCAIRHLAEVYKFGNITRCEKSGHTISRRFLSCRLQSVFRRLSCLAVV